MSAETLQKLYERVASEVEQACAEGRGKELIDTFFRDIAADLADTVFLKMDEEMRKVADDEEAERYLAWAEEFPYLEGLRLVGNVTETLISYRASEADIAAAQALTATAFSERLNFLFDSSHKGGAA